MMLKIWIVATMLLFAITNSANAVVVQSDLDGEEIRGT